MFQSLRKNVLVWIVLSVVHENMVRLKTQSNCAGLVFMI